MPGNASGGMEGVAVKPLTVGFHETQFLGKLNGENKLGFWFQLDDKQRQQAGSPWGPNNPQALNRYSYVQNNPLKYTDPSGHHPLAAVLAFFGIASVGPIIAALAVVFTVVTLATFLSDAGNRDWLSAQINGGITNTQQFVDNLMLMARGNDYIDYLQAKYGLSQAQRNRLHRAILKKNLTKEEIEEIAQDIAAEKGGERERDRRRNNR